MKYIVPLIFISVLLIACTPEQQCCEALTASCKACSAGMTVEEFCEADPDFPDCSEQENPCAAMLCLVGTTCEVFDDGTAACVPQDATRCTEKPELCTLDYNPVCGADGETYSNGCGACAAGVEFHTPGECKSAYTECTEPRPEACTREYRPVCGTVDTGARCITEPCDVATTEKTYGNACDACADKNVYGYTEGACAQEAQTCDATTPCSQGQECWAVGNDEPRCYESAPSCESVCGTSECAVLESYPPRIQCTGTHWLCEDECVKVDGCPRGYDEYGSQTGPACVKHMGVEELDDLPVCATANDCEGSCALVPVSTDGAQIKWPAESAFRCVPSGYANFLIHTSGLTTKDESGQESTVIA